MRRVIFIFLKDESCVLLYMGYFKKVSRMPGNDRSEVLKILRKQKRKRQRELCLKQAVEEMELHHLHLSIMIGNIGWCCMETTRWRLKM